MSTRLTSGGVAMVESDSLGLVFNAAKVNEGISLYLANELKRKGYHGVTPSVLQFLSTLECGVNYGSEIARSLSVSRQMVAKMVKEQSKLGYLEQVVGPGRQKQILFTESGELLMADARQLLAELDDILAGAIGKTSLRDTLQQLAKIQATLVELNTK